MFIYTIRVCKLLLPIVFFTLFSEFTIAQKTFTGNYRLTGVHDMASGFQFNIDGTFNFFYMYGAVDRFAKGTYQIVGDTIKLISEKEPGNDFNIKAQSKKTGKFKVLVEDNNPYLISYVTAIVLKGEEMQYFESDKDGVIDIDMKACDKIFLKHELYIDIPTEIKSTENDNNYFEVSLKESLQQVSFRGIDLFFDGDNLRCYSNYFLPFENIVFVKED